MARFRSAAIVQMGGSVARLTALFLVGRWIAQELGPVGVATMGQVQNLVALASALGVQAMQAGFQQGAAARDSIRARRAWMSSGILLGCLLVLLGSAGVAIAWALGGIALPFHGRWWIPFLPFLILPNVWIAALQGDALGRGLWTRTALWNSGSGILQALIWGSAVSIWGLAGLVGAILAQSVLLWPFAWRFFADSGFRPPPRLRTWWRAWFPLLAAGGAGAILLPLSGIVLRTLMLHHGWEGAGIWQAAVRIPELLYPLWNGVVGAWVLSRVASSGRQGLDPALLLKALAGTVGISLVFFLAAGPILHLAWGPGFESSAPLLRLQVVAEIPRSLVWILTMALLGQKRAAAVVLLEAVGFSMQCGGTYLLHERWGLAAPGLASLVDNLVCLALAATLWMRERKRS